MKDTDSHLIQRAIEALPVDHSSRKELADLKKRLRHVFASANFGRTMAKLEPNIVKGKCKDMIARAIAKHIIDSLEIHYDRVYDEHGNEVKDWWKMLGVVAVVMPARSTVPMRSRKPE